MKVEMFSTQKSAIPLSFSDFDFPADLLGRFAAYLQGRFGRFTNLALYFPKAKNSIYVFQLWRKKWVWSVGIIILFY